MTAAHLAGPCAIAGQPFHECAGDEPHTTQRLAVDSFSFFCGGPAEGPGDAARLGPEELVAELLALDGTAIWGCDTRSEDAGACLRGSGGGFGWSWVR